MGLNSRRGATRNASNKAKYVESIPLLLPLPASDLSVACSRLSSDAGRSASPFLGTEDGMLSDDGKLAPPGKGKGRSKTKRVGKSSKRRLGYARVFMEAWCKDDAEFNLHRKRVRNLCYYRLMSRIEC